MFFRDALYRVSVQHVPLEALYVVTSKLKIDCSRYRNENYLRSGQGDGGIWRARDQDQQLDRLIGQIYQKREHNKLVQNASTLRLQVKEMEKCLSLTKN